MIAAATHRWRPGSLVSARGRNWVVIPSDQNDTILLKPVDSADGEVVGIFTPLEPNAIEEAAYPLPNPERVGDFSGALLLRDAVRLTLRAGAGPFRSVGRLSVTPRPYQYVPLIMALRMDPVRLLVADDVGVGKTIEAAMIARELLDRGAVRRVGVLCPPHLCEQWATELSEKFGIEAAIVQPARMGRLERALPRSDVHVFEHYPHLVVSIDYVKSDRHKHVFTANAPDLIIVDEAHGAARPGGDGAISQQRRHQILSALAQDPKRHIILATATPHSGVESSFRSLLGILDRDLDLPTDQNIPRRRLLPRLIQRRRSDLTNWLGADTPFPKRDNRDAPYRMSREYTRLYERILGFCRQTVSGADGQRRRVRYWAAVAIMRSALSSPASAEATLSRRAERKRGELAQSEVGEEEFAAQILDSDAEVDTAPDYAPTSPLDDSAAALTAQEIRRLDDFLRQARALKGPKLDAKLAAAAKAVDEMLSEGYHPIVYCRFIDTAEYVAEHLQRMLEGRYPGLRVQSVTGGDGNDEQRREIVADLASSPRRTLVATDCLSEGINLQESFDAVLHYDLPWNPNRLEQREGRIDRYGQPRGVVRIVLLRGEDNHIDRAVLRVLIRKAREIRNRLGISVAASVESDAVVQAVVEDVFMQRGGYQLSLDTDEHEPRVSEYHEAVDSAAERESRNRAYFAQQSIRPDEVEREMREMEPALGGADDVRRFVQNAIQRFNGRADSTRKPGVFELHPGDMSRVFADRMPGMKFPSRVSFDGSPRPDAVHLGRNHPLVSALAEAVLSGSLEEDDPLFARCGAIVTDAVERRAVVVLLRLRYSITERGREQFAEEVVPAAFQRVMGKIEWLHPLRERALELLSHTASRRNPDPGEPARATAAALKTLSDDDEWAAPIIAERKAALEAAHKRLRGVLGDNPLTISAHSPPDILGCFVLIPSGKS